jgi:predicted XRE-type DNA-binding protein
MTISHVTPADGNIFRDLDFDPEEAGNLKIRSELMIEIRRIVRGSDLTQTEAAELFGTTQPRISELTRGRIEQFTIDSLVNMLTHAGVRVELRLAEAGSPGGTSDVSPPT